MKISHTIKEHRDPLDTALRRKAGNETLSVRTLEKFKNIANDRFECGAGAAFTGGRPAAPPRENTHAQLQLKDLRNMLAAEQMNAPDGSCLHRFLGQVLKRLPDPQLIEPPSFIPRATLQRPALPNTGASKEPLPDYDPQPLKSILKGPHVPGASMAKTTFGDVTVNNFDDHPQESRIGDKPLLPGAQLAQFMEDGLGVGYSEGERNRLWDAAQDDERTRPFAERVVKETASRACAAGKMDLLPPLETLVEVIRQAGAERPAA